MSNLCSLTLFEWACEYHDRNHDAYADPKSSGSFRNGFLFDNKLFSSERVFEWSPICTRDDHIE